MDETPMSEELEEQLLRSDEEEVDMDSFEVLETPREEDYDSDATLPYEGIITEEARRRQERLESKAKAKLPTVAEASEEAKEPEDKNEQARRRKEPEPIPSTSWQADLREAREPIVNEPMEHQVEPTILSRSTTSSSIEILSDPEEEIVFIRSVKVPPPPKPIVVFDLPREAAEMEKQNQAPAAIEGREEAPDTPEESAQEARGPGINTLPVGVRREGEDHDAPGELLRQTRDTGSELPNPRPGGFRTGPPEEAVRPHLRWTRLDGRERYPNNARPVLRPRLPGCFNCGFGGHHYSACRHPRQCFCFRCGIRGVTVRDCPACSFAWRREGPYVPHLNTHLPRNMRAAPREEPEDREEGSDRNV